jgi:hypothetical protein
MLFDGNVRGVPEGGGKPELRALGGTGGCGRRLGGGGGCTDRFEPMPGWVASAGPLSGRVRTGGGGGLPAGRYGADGWLRCGGGGGPLPAGTESGDVLCGNAGGTCWTGPGGTTVADDPPTGGAEGVMPGSVVRDTPGEATPGRGGANEGRGGTAVDAPLSWLGLSLSLIRGCSAPSSRARALHFRV